MLIPASFLVNCLPDLRQLVFLEDVWVQFQKQKQVPCIHPILHQTLLITVYSHSTFKGLSQLELIPLYCALIRGWRKLTTYEKAPIPYPVANLPMSRAQAPLNSIKMSNMNKAAYVRRHLLSW